jgi:hypothetical protein
MLGHAAERRWGVLTLVVLDEVEKTEPATRKEKAWPG